MTQTPYGPLPPLPPSQIDWDKVGRYLTGEASAEETAEVRRWFRDHPSDATVVAALDSATRNLGAEPGIDVEAALRHVKTRMHAPAPAFGRVLRKPTPRTMYGLAAAAVIVIAVVVTVRGRPGAGSHQEVAEQTVHSTGVGERSTVHLADGTEVMLGPVSRLTAQGRDVRLTGEGFFRVVHNAARPFTVRAGDAVIRDVGTAFSVHDDAGDRVRVVVSEGAVRVTSPRDSVQLARGDVAVLEGGALAAQRGTATPEDLAWTTGTLVFRDASFDEVSADLKRWYGVEVRVTDSLLVRRHFTGSFTNEPATRVLDILALALGARVDRQGDTAYIRGTSSIR